MPSPPETERRNAEDRAAVDRVLGGEVEAFALLVRRWQGPLVNLAWRFCRDRGRAEDMAQEAFLRAFRNLGQWRREAAFSTWLFALATNHYRSALKRLPATTLSLEEIAHVPEGLFAEQGHEAAQQAEQLRRAVLTLPAKYRDAVTLFYFHEQSVPEAALSLGVPEGTVKVRLHRGRELLRDKLRRRSRTPPASMLAHSLHKEPR